ncbi:hypothetical protein [Gracilibacillus massiliensis]|uniref:hypothetical protein n=1 Tax=Gracilibacillus massiliensis TaxID=1564956 RepID=UPI00071C5BEB|nr:hypothetical protein [Gracilibacillus massiliensis]
MRKFLIGLCLFIMTGLLVGCVSIPLNDGVLKMSSEGIEFVNNESDENNSESDETNNVNNESDEQAEQTEETDENTEGSDSVQSEENEEATSDAKPSACEEQDYSDVTDSIDAEIFIPNCAIINSVNKNSSYVSADFIVEPGDWEEILNEYKEFLGEKVQGENKNIQSQFVRLDAVLSDEGRSQITIQQDEENVGLSYIHYYSN